VNAAAVPVERLRVRLAASTTLRVALGLVFLVAISLLMRDTAIRARYWIDEGLSVGIAHHPLGDIPGLLRQDGSPPLYYLLLGVWIRVLGDGEARTHALSLAFALLTVPVGFAAGRALFSERAGWIVAVLAALNPFLNYYAQETRMYSLVVLLSMVVATTFVLGFVHRRRRWLIAFTLAGAALAYTHNWGLFVLAGTAIALVPLLRARAVPWRDAALAYGGIALLYLPWVPTVIYQARHTGAPWSTRPSVGDLPGTLATLAGGPGPAVALLLIGGSGVAAYLARRPPTQASKEAVATRSLGMMLLAALLVAFVASQISPAWTVRYLAALVGPGLVLAGSMLARAGTMGLITAALVAGLWLHPPTSSLNNKSDVHHVAVLIRDRVAPGDIVVSTHPEQVPVLHFYFPPGLRWASGMGWVRDTGIMDWRDALDRYRHTWPRPTSDRFIRALRPGQQLVLVQPIIRTARWGAPWTKLVRHRAKRWEWLLDHDPRVRRAAAIPHFGHRKLPKGVRVVLYRRV
jgi:hypothetical protein